ncbi:MAG: Transcriptional regulator, AcrR family [uncultured Thermoleophilia bacterium]|uniref:Transcriptional regulator, AcrR family n=1 Tax=uncultured Thermoleophilia bacterium TaxID=1497501 RepID=A0A6J4U7S9_9ACTN|nr:MAG: Transcriptional regulator, AcrR family [uncultured Thermoleophilia bacterium]
MARTKRISDAAVLAVAADLVGRVGPRRLTLADVAAETGLSPATLVQRFGSKRQLLLAVAARGADGVTRLAEARDGPGSTVDRLVGGLVALAEPVGRPEELVNHLAFLQLDLRDDAFRAHAGAFARSFDAAVREVLDAAVAAGELSATDTTALARRVQVTYHGALLTWALAGTGPLAVELEQQLRATLASARA